MDRLIVCDTMKRNQELKVANQKLAKKALYAAIKENKVEIRYDFTDQVRGKHDAPIVVCKYGVFLIQGYQVWHKGKVVYIVKLEDSFATVIYKKRL